MVMAATKVKMVAQAAVLLGGDPVTHLAHLNQVELNQHNQVIQVHTDLVIQVQLEGIQPHHQVQVAAQVQAGVTAVQDQVEQAVLVKHTIFQEHLLTMQVVAVQADKMQFQEMMVVRDQAAKAAVVIQELWVKAVTKAELIQVAAAEAVALHKVMLFLVVMAVKVS
jgi:hypothetical protein